MFFKIWDKHAPIKKRKISSKRLAWLTSDLIHEKHHLKFLHRKARSNNTTESWLTYKKAKNRYNRHIKNSKRYYYEKRLHSHSGNIKQTWKTINEILNKSSSRNKINEIKDENGEILDETSISNAFNKYFVELGEKLASEIPQSNVSPMNFLNEIYLQKHAFPYFYEIAANDIQLHLQNLNTKNVSGIDGNYRPISIISVVARIFEKLIYNQIYEYINNYNLLTNSQHGFRPFHSTVTALLNITNTVHPHLSEPLWTRAQKECSDK